MGEERVGFWPPPSQRSRRFLTQLHLVTKHETVRGWALVAVAWLPLVTAAALRVALGARPDAIAYDLSVHVRLVIALPLLVRFDGILGRMCRGAAAALYRGAYADHPALDAIFGRAERLRSSRWAVAGLVALAAIGGQLALWGVVGSAGAFHGGSAPESLSFSRLWYALVSLPLFQFMMFRWVWQWLVWTYVLARLARLPLALIATHPDRVAGLSPLGWPIVGATGFVLAMGAVISGAWSTQLVAQRVTLPGLFPGMLAFVLGAIAFTFGPLLLFCGHLFRARARALAAYTQFALDYVVQFHAKWIEQPVEPGAELGAQDIQALNDLGGAYGVIATTRLFVFAPKKLIQVAVAAVVPMLPLLTSTVTVEKLLRHLVGLALGGLPI